MKKLTLFSSAIKMYCTVCLWLFFTPILSSQTKIQNSESIPNPNYFVGGGLGFNDYGIGTGGEVKGQNVWGYGCVGISTWGVRLTGGISYYPDKTGYQSSFSFGYSYATGINDFEPTLAVKKANNYTPSSKTYNKTVLMDLNPVSTLNFIYSYNVKSGKKSKFVVSGGYALNLKDKLYRNKTSYELTEESKNYLDLLAPGGIIFGIKYMIGV